MNLYGHIFLRQTYFVKDKLSVDTRRKQKLSKCKTRPVISLHTHKILVGVRGKRMSKISDSANIMNMSEARHIHAIIILNIPVENFAEISVFVGNEMNHRGTLCGNFTGPAIERGCISSVVNR